MLGLLVTGCAESDEADPASRVEGLVDRQVDELHQQSAVLCDCWSDFGFESRSGCEGEVLAIGPAQVRCLKDAFTQDPEVSLDYLECIVPLEQEYTACIDQRLECSDSSASDACIEDYSVGLDACIGLPSAITRDLDACFE
ncbi:MAG: hypothetical protein KDK70_08835 [Myxococcales bacterium]|nr:hypothetical protein [Myxococcales bacterium]